MSLPDMPERSPFSRRLLPWGRALVDLFYPRACRVCDEPLSVVPDGGSSLERWVCMPCMGSLSRVEPPFCSACGEPFDGAMSQPFRCMNCADRKFAFEFAVSGFRAEGAVRDLIHRFKYNRDQSLRSLLAAMLGRALDDPRLAGEKLGGWLLVPVPLYRGKEAERGFNQSLELCLALTKQSGIQTLDCLTRVRDTGSQASLHRNERLKNLRQAFAMRRRLFQKTTDLTGTSILLVDDVLTTGATTHECARILMLDGGAEKVVVITVARG